MRRRQRILRRFSLFNGTKVFKLGIIGNKAGLTNRFLSLQLGASLFGHTLHLLKADTSIADLASNVQKHSHARSVVIGCAGVGSLLMNDGKSHRNGNQNHANNRQKAEDAVGNARCAGKHDSLKQQQNGKQNDSHNIGYLENTAIGLHEALLVGNHAATIVIGDKNDLAALLGNASRLIFGHNVLADAALQKP